MKRIILNYLNQDPISFWPISLNLLTILLITLSILVTKNYLPQKLPLFYSLPWGESQLATPLQFIIIPGLSIIILLTNLIISWHLHSSQTLLKRILIFSSLIISLLLFLTVLKVLTLFV